MQPTAWAEISLSALTHNLKQVKGFAPNSKIATMIKADAYGHGLLAVAKALASHTDKLGVARLEEAATLRKAGIETPILLMGTILDTESLHFCAQHEIAIAVHSEELGTAIAETALGNPLEVWLKVDTGMNRLGLSHEQALACFQRLKENKAVNIACLMTHFSSSETDDRSTTQHQIDRFKSLAGALPAMPYSLANSGAIISWPESHCDWVRPGIMLYGDNPVLSQDAGLKPVMTLKTRVIAINKVDAGESVGYNGIWTASRDSTIAALGIGYGDGYPRQLGNGAPVLINGERLPLAGRISMDISTVDITDAKSDIRVGDEVTLWGEELSAAEIAKLANTISYHLFTGVTQRVPRIYK